MRERNMDSRNDELIMIDATNKLMLTNIPYE